MIRAPLHIPRLHCPPLVLRAFTAADALWVVEASRDPYIPATTTVPKDPSPQEVKAFLDRQLGLWPHGQGRASVGYWVLPSARGRGIATTALTCLSAWGLDQPGIARLELYIEPGNEGSLRAAAAAGYEQEGLLRDHHQIDGHRRDMLLLTRVSHATGHDAPGR